MIYADRVLLAQLAATNTQMGREIVGLLEAMREGHLPAPGLDALGEELIELGGRLRRRAAELSEPHMTVDLATRQISAY